MPSSERTLLVLRHAKSDWGDAGQADADRPLSARGRRSAAEVAVTLARLSTPTVVVCSPSRRTVQTWESIRHAAPDAQVVFDPRMYLGSAEDLLDVLTTVDSDPSCVLLIGHNPGVSELVSRLTEGSSTSIAPDLPTAALVVVQFTGAWSELSARTVDRAAVTLHGGRRGSAGRGG